MKVIIPSAKDRVPPRWLILLGIALLVSLLTGLLTHPLTSVFLLTGGFGAVCVLYSACRISAVIYKPQIDSAPPIDDPDLPVFTLLLPVYKEAHMIDALIKNVSRLHYPPGKLDIMILCEPDDSQTITAARAAARGHIRVFVTDGTGPRTKPNALNAALPSAKGEIITVYDAEDNPHPSQLLAAAHALAQDARLAVVQAPLTYYNANQNWLTRQFTLEYDALFQVWIPFLSKLDLPFPLGGTSNHIRRSALEAVGGWDAHNVTEDADLSFRFAALGLKLGYITPPTYEEAIARWRPWRNQRSRWMKGYMQTWLTHMDKPLLPGGAKGFLRFITLQLTLGVTLIAGLFHVPALILLAAIILYGAATRQTPEFHSFFVYSLIFSYLTAIIVGMTGAVRTKRPRLLISALAMPIYWTLLVVPTYQALWEMVLRPFYWSKTDHGDMGSAAPLKATDILVDFAHDRHP